MSSEALEAKRLRENATRRNTMGLLMTCEPTDVLALLAEVARLEQASQTFTADDQSQARRIDELNAMLRASEEHTQLAEAALAVARDREQRLREAAQALVDAWGKDASALVLAEHRLRAALVDEPAAGRIECTAFVASPRSPSGKERGE